MKLIGIFGVILLTLSFHSKGITAESPVLTADGLALGRHSVSSISNGLSIKVDLNGDEVTATYVTARFQNNAPRQRTESGYWQPWNELTETLQDNAFAPTEDGSLTFEVTDESLSEQFLPIVFTVAYRTETGVKSGYVVIDR